MMSRRRKYSPIPAGRARQEYQCKLPQCAFVHQLVLGRTPAVCVNTVSSNNSLSTHRLGTRKTWQCGQRMLNYSFYLSPQLMMNWNRLQRRRPGGRECAVIPGLGFTKPLELQTLTSSLYDKQPPIQPTWKQIHDCLISRVSIDLLPQPK